MNRMQYNRLLNDLQGDLKRVDSTLSALQTTNPERYPGNLETLSLNAAYQMEALTCRMRHIIYRNTEVTKREYLSGAAEPAGIRLFCSGCAVSVILPELLPGRKCAAGHEYIAGPLFELLAQSSRQQRLPRFTTCTLCVMHCFAPGWRDRVVPDYDNLELKTVQDILAAFCLVDDSMKYCNRYETTRTDNLSHTEFHIIRQEDFPVWLERSRDGIAGEKEAKKSGAAPP